MFKPIAFLYFLFVLKVSYAQTPVAMGFQPNFTYTQDFADIVNWTNGFAAGIGANNFGAVAVSAVGSIPSANKTTASTASFTTGSGAGVQKGTENIVLLSTGTTNNSSSTAFDLALDFSKLNAGNVSFDWASVNNATGNRTGSLRIYASTDKINFTELTAAAVLDFTNNVLTSGRITNVALPAAFNESATAILRFYNYNSAGGSTGSRPKISIDNITVTATSINACAAPTAQPTQWSLATTTATSIVGNFTAAATAPDQYLTIASTNSSLASGPLNGQTYFIGDGLGDGVVVDKSNANNFIANNLPPATKYYFFTYAVNSVCSNGPLYLSTNPLQGSATTADGLPACVAPIGQATNLTFTNSTTSSISGSFSATAADEYLVLYSKSSSLSNSITNGQTYFAGDAIGNATVVQQGIATSFVAIGLLSNTSYYFYVLSSNARNCTNGPVYNKVSPLTKSTTTPSLPACSMPSIQPTNLELIAGKTVITGSFTPAAGVQDYLIISSSSPTLSALPQNNTNYVVGNMVGSAKVLSVGTSTQFIYDQLTSGNTYYFFVFAANINCVGGAQYLTLSPLSSNATTSNTVALNYYFGNLHAHSDYSDGNKDNPNFTPMDNYNYAQQSMCMDYLGISEHNHYTSNGNPGNHLSTYHEGVNQAASFNATHTNFVALYGMEWGTIGGGGHVLVYGDGMDELMGWESGAGGWGTSNNYDVFVPKDTYTGNTGLFKSINDRIATNSFGSCAHPGSSDFNNLGNSPYDASADSAISGTAVESGPAFSTSSTYNDPAGSMNHLSYYQLLLSKGYHLGPAIDHDNHYTTFGRTTHSRTAVVAPSISKSSIISAMRNMHFYATQDCDTKVDFTLNAAIMGSITSGSAAPVIAVHIEDATTATSSAVTNVMFGMPGSGILPAKIYSATGNSFYFTDNSLPTSSTGYYYLDITNNGSRIITAPIWYTKNSAAATPLPVRLSAFDAKKIAHSVQLHWNTEQEMHSSYFVIERATDGVHWTALGSLTAAGNSSHPNSYQYFDNYPVAGNNYYRLKQVDKDGAWLYSRVQLVAFNTEIQMRISPTPAHQFTNINIAQSNNLGFEIELMNSNGQRILSKNCKGNTTQLNTATLAKGLYFIRWITGKNSGVYKLLIQ